MRLKGFALLLTLLINGMILAAQDEFVIRMNVTANLRSAAGMHGAILDKARAGEMLHIVDRKGDWLAVARNGRTMWLADWLDYTVLNTDEPIQLTSRFVDLDCDRGPAWDEAFGGMWDFTVMECDFDFRPPDSVLPAHMKTIPVEGPADLVDEVTHWMELLKQQAPEWYAYIYDVADKIVIYERGSSLDIVSGMAYVLWDSRDIYLSRYAAAESSGNIIGIVIHEACHLYQFQAGLSLARYESEALCHTIELYAAQEVGWGGSVASLKGAIKYNMFLR